jgi:hypothetical protein
MFKKLKDMQLNEIESENRSEPSLVSVSSEQSYDDNPNEIGRKDIEEALKTKRKLKLLYYDIE